MKKWEEKQLGEIADIKTGPFGSVLHACDYVIVGTPIITVEHLGDYSITRQNLPLVSDIDKYRLSAYTLNKGDIVFSRVGSVDRNAYVTENEDGWLFSGRLLRIRIFENEAVDARYLSYYFKFEATKARICSVAVGQTMASLNTKIMKDFIVEYPPLPEQRRIAKALSDTDKLIATLEELITKKHAIKQSTMQELLTGKRRLPEFSGEWRTTILGDLCNVLNGYAFQSATYVSNGKYRIITISNVQQGYLELSDCVTIKQLPNNIQPYQMLKIGDILISLTGNVGRTCKITAHDLLLNQRVGLISNYKCDRDFLYYTLQSTNFVNTMILSAKGGAQPNLSNKDIYEYEVKIPPTTAEQTAIASILSDMDVEINTLSVKLNKLRNIKQGMMSELLTGHIRLVEQDDKEHSQLSKRANQNE